MKKIIAIILMFVLCFTVLAACGETDNTELLNRITQLEDELEQAKSEGLKGDKGDKGDTGAQGPKGEPGVGVQEFKIHNLGETFTYVNSGMPLFSIKVTRNLTDSQRPHITVKNLNTSNFYPNDYIKMQHLVLGNSAYSTVTFILYGDTILPIGEERTMYGGGGFFDSELVYFGLPLTNSSRILPYAIFKIQ